MTAFRIWTSVAPLRPCGFVARAYAVPIGGALRCAPEARTVVSPTRGDAAQAAEVMARMLAADIRARANEAIRDGCDVPATGWVEPGIVQPHDSPAPAGHGVGRPVARLECLADSPS